MSEIITTAVKKVNITAPIPIRTVFPNIYGKVDGVMMTPSNILKCLIARATVYEVLSDGSLCKLNYNNYNKVNKPLIRSTKPKEKVQKLVTKAGSAIDVTEVRRSKVIKAPKELTSKDDKDHKENSTNTSNVEDMVDTIKDDTGKKVELPKEEISKDKPAEVNIVSKDEEDPELAEIAAEIAKMEAEEAANKNKEK